MDEEETLFRKQLRRLRYLATSIGFSYQDEQIMFGRWPETQARAIVEGMGYQMAAMMLVDTTLLSGQLRWEDFKYLKSTGLPATREEIIKDLYQLQEKRLKEKFDPLEIYSQVIMPLVKSKLEKMEHIMVNQSYLLPKWERPKWLKEMEAKTD